MPALDGVLIALDFRFWVGERETPFFVSERRGVVIG
jgi:hypothetical protein